MNISLTPEFEEYVNGKVRSGLYHSASEVICEALRLLREKDKVDRKKIQALRAIFRSGSIRWSAASILLSTSRHSKKSGPKDASVWRTNESRRDDS